MGLENAEKKKAKEIAKKLLEDGKDGEYILEITGLKKKNMKIKKI